MKRMIAACLGVLFLLTGSALAKGDKTLTIAGGFILDAPEVKIFQERHPEMEVVESDRYETREIVEDAVSHADTVDLYFFHTLSEPTYRQLRDRGFLLPIEDEKLLEYMEGVYPELVAGCKSGDAVCAVPLSTVAQFSIFVNLEVWESLGYAEQDLPSTWGEFVGFLAREGPAIVRAHDDISLLNVSDENLTYLLLQWIENNYKAYRSRSTEMIGFDTAEFREVLSAFSEVQRDVIANRGGKILFHDRKVGVRQNDLRFLPLSFVEGDAAIVPVGMFVGAINPNSKNIPEAIEFLQIAVEMIDPIALREMNRNVNTPVEDEAYIQSLVENYNRAKEEYEGRIAAAGDALTKAELEQEWAHYAETSRSYYEQYGYAATEESIQAYREYIEGRLVPIYNENISYEEYDVVNAKREQFLAHQISADQYINELERRFVANVLEGQ